MYLPKEVYRTPEVTDEKSTSFLKDRYKCMYKYEKIINFQIFKQYSPLAIFIKVYEYCEIFKNIVLNILLCPLKLN